MFMGNPSPEARKLWIKFKGEKCQNQDNYEDIKMFINNENELAILVNETINFSADALRKFLERFFQ